MQIQISYRIHVLCPFMFTLFVNITKVSGLFWLLRSHNISVCMLCSASGVCWTTPRYTSPPHTRLSLPPPPIGAALDHVTWQIPPTDLQISYWQYAKRPKNLQTSTGRRRKGLCEGLTNRTLLRSEEARDLLSPAQYKDDFTTSALEIKEFIALDCMVC